MGIGALQGHVASDRVDPVVALSGGQQSSAWPDGRSPGVAGRRLRRSGRTVHVGTIRVASTEAEGCISVLAYQQEAKRLQRARREHGAEARPS